MPGLDVICGRVIGIRKVSSFLCFLTLNSQNGLHRVIIENLHCPAKKGDLIRVSGKWVHHLGREEFHVIEDVIIEKRPASLLNLPFYLERTFELARMERLSLRIVMLQQLHRFFYTHDFLPYTSPTIVGKWVKGQTGSFDISFYDKPASLSISNMMYHHIAMANGFQNLYEISKIFRQENPSSKERLAEFTILDLSLSQTQLPELMLTVEKLIRHLLDHFNGLKTIYHNFPDPIWFEYISFQELIQNAGLEKISGHQLPKSVRSFMNENYKSFVWVTNFPQNTRPFFVKCVDGYGVDCQLWYQGKQYLAAGGEREMEINTIRNKILAEGKKLEDYSFFLQTLEFGVPEFVSIGMGIERFLGTILDQSVADFSFFPRYQGNLTP